MLQKGQTNNLKGRAAGIPNKANRELRGIIKKLLSENYETFNKRFNRLPLNEYVRSYISLLRYSIPPMQATRDEVDFSDLGDKQLEYLVECLLGGKKPLKSELMALSVCKFDSANV